MDVFKTQGAFSWSELLTPDPKAAAEFYGGLFGWAVSVSNMGTGPYHVVSAGGAQVAGMMSPPPDSPPMPPAWGVYVTVDNVDETVAKCTALGGAVCVPPMDVPTVGRMAVLRDPQGAVFSVITYEAG